MGIADRKERQKAELREQIMEASRQIVNAEGLGALTIRRIAAAIEYAPGTIYLYFANRDDIARQLVRDGFVELLSYMAPAAAQPDPLKRLTAIGRAYARFGVERPETYRTIFLQPPDISKALVDMIKAEDGDGNPGDRAFNILALTVGELIERGTFKPADPVVVAETIWAWLHGLMALRISCSADVVTDFDASVELILGGIPKAFAA